MRGPTGAAGAEAYRFFCIAGAATTNDRFLELRGANVQPSEMRGNRQVPRATTLTSMRVYLRNPYVTANATIALRVAGVDSALAGTISAGGQVLTVTGMAVGVTAGQALSVRLTLDSAEANSTLGISVVVY
jgi:hypothetical protein